MLFRLVRKWQFAAGMAVAIGVLALPAQALALRYASPTGSALADCQTPATACTLKTAIQGNGGNLPSESEEVVVLTGTYPTQTAEISAGAPNLNIHGESGQPRPLIRESGLGRLLMSSGALGYLRFETTGDNEAVNISGATIDRVFMQASAGPGSNAVCQCSGGVVRDSVFVTNNPTQPALGIESNGGSGNGIYRNVTAYSTVPGTPAIGVFQDAMTGTLEFTVHNSIALNAAGGADVVADGPNSTITLSNSNYRSPSTTQGGVIQDTPGAVHQTALPLFTDAGGGEFSELAGSPTIDAGLTDSDNGPLDFAGNPRTAGGGTDIGAYEFLPAAAPAAPTFVLARTVKINRKGSGRLGFTCTSPAGEVCAVAATLRAGGKAKKGNLGRVRGSVPAGTKATVLVKLKRPARRRLAAKRKLRAQVTGTVTGAAGVSSPLAASLKLRAKR
jgi:hypothetical protein